MDYSTKTKEELIVELQKVNVELEDIKTSLRKSVIHQNEIAEELSQSEKDKYESLFVNNHSVMLLIDPETLRIKDANKAASEFYGWTHDELCSKKISEINMLSEEKLFSEIKSIREGEKRHFYFKHLLANGEVRDVEIHSGPMKIGDSILLYSIIQDITDRKNAEIDLIKFRSISDQAIHGVFITSLEGKFLYVNDPIGRMFGWEKTDLIGQDFHILHNKEQSKRASEIEQLIRTEGGFAAEELYYTRKDGSVFPGKMSVKIIFNEVNVAQMISGTITDISEIKNVEGELKVLSQAVEQSPVMTVISDLSGRIIYANPKIIEITGYSKEELIGNNTRIFSSGELPEEEYKNLWKTISSGGKWKGEFHNKKKNNELYWASATVSPVFDSESNIIFYLSVQEDITLKKEPEKAIIALNESLEFKVEERTSQLKEMNEYLLNEVNERKLAEDQLKQMTFRSTLAVRAGRIGIWDWDIENNILVWDDQMLELYGIKKENFVGAYESWLAGMHPEDTERGDAEIKAAIRGEKEFDTEFRVVWPDCSIHDIRALALVERDSSGKPYHMIGTNWDITEQKRIETALDTEKQRLASIIEGTNAGTWGWNIQTGETIFNERWAEIIGYTLSELHPINIETWKRNTHPDDLEIADKLFQKHLTGELTYYMVESRMKHKNGDYVWVKVSGKVHEWDQKGKPLVMSGTFHDISKDKEAENKLKWNKSLLELMSNSSPLGFLVVDNRTDTILYFNHRFCEIWNIEQLADQMNRGELKNNDIIPYCLPVLADIPAFAESCKPVQDENNRIVLTDVIPFINNRTVKRFSTQIRGDQDEYFGRFYIFEEVTDLKRADEFEKELVQLSIQMTGIPVSEVQTALNKALNKIGTLMSADRAYIFEFSDEETTMSNTYEWCSQGINAEIENLQQIPIEILPMWMAMLQRHENIIIPSVKDLPESWHTEREMLEPQGIQSLIVIPIINTKGVIGFIGLDNVITPKVYTESEIRNLRLWSNMLSSILNKQRIDLILNQTRENYESFFNTIDDLLFVLDEQGNIIYTNQTVIDRLEYERDELTGKSVLMVHPADRREEAGRIVGEMLAGTADYCPVPLLAKSGSQIPVETRIKRGFWDGLSVIFGVSKDVSKLRLSEEKFSRAFHSNYSIMAISGVDDTVFIDINDSFTRTLGYTKEEIIGKTILEYDFFVNKDQFSEIYKKLELNGSIREAELEIRAKSGSIIIALYSADFIYVGTRQCLLSLLIDITERKRAEKEIKEARIEAEKANLAKSEFLSRMSHELRTPLNSILGFAQLMEMSKLGPLHKRNVGFIYQGGIYLLNLINEILDISRIEAGRISLSIEPVQISQVINEIMDAVQPMAGNRNINLELVDSPMNQFFIKADNNRLKQVLLNLLSNAVKYNNKGGTVKIYVEVKPVNEIGIVNIRISIADTGIGISEDNKLKLFTAFERIGAENTETEGTGLGLVMVKKLITAMGGEIGIQSTVGKGSTFWFELPLAEDIKLNSRLQNYSTGISETESIHLGTILYIEDNNSNLELVEQILLEHRSNIRLITDLTGSQALKLAIKNLPDLILLDLNLPKIHGSKILSLLLKEEKTKDIPVVIVSADAMPEQRKKLLSAGAREYITKPLNIIEFLKVVDEYIPGKNIH